MTSSQPSDDSTSRYFTKPATLSPTDVKPEKLESDVKTGKSEAKLSRKRETVAIKYEVQDPERESAAAKPKGQSHQLRRFRVR